MPAPFEPGRIGLENAAWLSEPVALTSLAAMVPEHEVRILDMRLEDDAAYARTLAEFQPQLVGTTSMTTDCYQAKALLHCAKSTLGDDVFTIVGGHHPTLAPWDFEHACVDALCLGEGEQTFVELVEHLAGGGDRRALGHIDGLRYRDASDAWATTSKRAQTRDLDSFPFPARHLVDKYKRDYFFFSAGPIASISTSRGCSYDCNFCAIWEFYERRTRFMSAARICDQLEQIDEKFVLLLDDNFLTKRSRLEELCDEIERRGIKKFWGTQGRSDFVAENPDLMRRMRDCGLTLLITGYETNDEEGLQFIKKSTLGDVNLRAADLLYDLGIATFGIFMVRPDFTHTDFDKMYAGIDRMRITLPIISCHTPLPGTQLRKKMQDELLTEDVRFYDVLHAVVPTRLPREQFYDRLSENFRRNWPGTRSFLNVLRKRPAFFAHSVPSLVAFVRRALAYQPVCQTGESHLRDEIGVIPRTLTSDNAPPVGDRLEAFRYDARGDHAARRERARDDQQSTVLPIVQTRPVREAV
jgi:radical SAM superfamily enzyme YgiQ (UPF0313 family)